MAQNTKGGDQETTQLTSGNFCESGVGSYEYQQMHWMPSLGTTVMHWYAVSSRHIWPVFLGRALTPGIVWYWRILPRFSSKGFRYRLLYRTLGERVNKQIYLWSNSQAIINALLKPKTVINWTRKL